MNAKKADKIATGILYAVSGVIVLILAALLIYILARGIPHISWEFLTQPSRAYQVGGGIGIQLFNSLYLLLITMIISIPISYTHLDVYKRQGLVFSFLTHYIYY
ncbi:phosphate ABC transporter permease [Enterococcus faecalis]|nr:phosphate ABC transporter permease [Enterococcus faecalis]